MNSHAVLWRSTAVALFVFLATVSSLLASGTAVYNVRDYGATGRKSEDARAAIQKAIDACATAGGGMVYLTPGEYTSGTLNLRSHVRFHIEAGATLFASQNEKDFDKKPPNHSGLFYGEDLANVTIEGRGTVDGQAEYDWRLDDHEDVFTHKRKMIELGKPLLRTFPKGFPQRQLYPFLVFLLRSKDVRITGLKFLHSPSWTICMYATEHVVIDGIYAYTSLKEGVWADGIDLDGCRDVQISNCVIETGDDCIIFISSPVWGPALACENITITNCRLSSASAAVKFSEGNWNVARRVTISNCVIEKSNRGFVFSVTQGGEIRDVVISGIVMDLSRFDWFWAGDGEPFYFRITRASEWNEKPIDPKEPPPGKIHNVKISNIIARAKGSSPVYGHPESWLDGIGFENVKLFLATDSSAPYDTANDAMKFRWAKNLRIKDVEVVWEKPPLESWQSALVFEDVRGLTLDGFHGRGASPERGTPAVAFTNVSDAVLSNSRAQEGTHTFLKVSGMKSRGIVLSGNDLRVAKSVFKAESGVPQDGVKVLNGLP